MAEPISRWFNKLEASRRTQSEMKEILADYFSSGINEDRELARGMGLDLSEIDQMRCEFEA